MKEESEKAGLKLNIQKRKIIASGPITPWQIDRKKVETMADFIFLGSKVTADSDCRHRIKRHLLLGRKAVTNLGSLLKNSHQFVQKHPYSQSYGWTIKKAECRRIYVFELWCWRRLLRVPWTERRSNQSILNELNPKYSLEGLMLKLKLQCSSHMMQKVDL